MTDKLKLQAREALVRRGSCPTALSLFRAQGRVHFLIYAVGILAVGALWMQGQRYLAIGIGGFYVGRLIRDFQWFGTLAKTWPVTSELLDWKKVEEIAHETDA